MGRSCGQTAPRAQAAVVTPGAPLTLHSGSSATLSAPPAGDQQQDQVAARCRRRQGGRLVGRQLQGDDAVLVVDGDNRRTDGAGHDRCR